MSFSQTAKRVITAAIGALTVSAAGISYIAVQEGKDNRAYPDPAVGWKLPTICYGHTNKVKRGDTRTDRECLSYLQADASDAALQVLAVVKVPLSQSELDAYTSFVFNVGIDKFRGSTMLAKLNSGDREGACRELPRWVYANGKILKGLVARRASESRMCLSGLPVSPTNPAPPQGDLP